MKTTLALWLVALLFTAFAFVANREEPSEPVTVIASRATTEVTAWPVETVPDLGPRFGELVSAIRRGKVKHPLRQGYRAAGSIAGSVWDRLAQCESGGNWQANTGNGYEGGLQFHPSTWFGYKDDFDPPHAYQASRERQIVVAEKVLRVQGWAAWPVCSRRVGAR